MNLLAGEIGLIVEARSMELQVKHLPGSVNIDADALSRLKEGRSTGIPKSLSNVLRVQVPHRCLDYYSLLAEQ